MCSETASKDVYICQSLLNSAVTKILKSYWLSATRASLSLVLRAAKRPQVPLHESFHSGTCPEKEQPHLGYCVLLAKGKEQETRSSHVTSFNAAQMWLLSYPFTFHRPKQVTQPNLEAGQGRIPCSRSLVNELGCLVLPEGRQQMGTLISSTIASRRQSSYLQSVSLGLLATIPSFNRFLLNIP